MPPTPLSKEPTPASPLLPPLPLPLLSPRDVPAKPRSALDTSANLASANGSQRRWLVWAGVVAGVQLFMGTGGAGAELIRKGRGIEAAVVATGTRWTGEGEAP
jgi:hypothetical protein